MKYFVILFVVAVGMIFSFLFLSLQKEGNALVKEQIAISKERELRKSEATIDCVNEMSTNYKNKTLQINSNDGDDARILFEFCLHKHGL